MRRPATTPLFRLGPLLALVLALAQLVPAQATGAKLSDRQRARLLLREGNRLHKEQRYELALARYRRARELYPSYKILLNIAVTLDAMGRGPEALFYFERFLEAAGKDPKARPRALSTARAKMARLLSRLGMLELRSSTTGAAVAVDGKSVGTVPLPRAIYLEAGEHEIRVSKAGYRPLERRLSIASGEQVTLEADLEAEPRPQPAVVQPSRQVDRGPGPEERRRRKRRLWAHITVGAAGALAVGAGVVFGVVGAEGSEAHEAYLAADTPELAAQRWDDVSAARTKMVAGYALGGAAVAAAGVAIYLYVTSSPDEKPRQAAGLSHLGLQPTEGGAALTLGGTF